MDGRPKRTRLMRFHQKIVSMWTGPKGNPPSAIFRINHSIKNRRLLFILDSILEPVLFLPSGFS